MKTVGSYEMKTHMSSLLKDVSAGESIIITLHGMPVAKLSPVEGPDRQARLDALAELKKLRVGRILNRGEIRQLIDEGRR